MHDHFKIAVVNDWLREFFVERRRSKRVDKSSVQYSLPLDNALLTDCTRKRPDTWSMTGNTEVIDGMKTKEFRSELARAGFPG